MKLDASVLHLTSTSMPTTRRPPNDIFGGVEVLDRSVPCSCLRPAGRLRRRSLHVTLAHLTRGDAKVRGDAFPPTSVTRWR